MKCVLLLTGFFLLLSFIELSDCNESKNFVDFVNSSQGEYGFDGKIPYTPRQPLKRFIRNIRRCKLPAETKHLLLACRVYPNRVNCIQHCPYGYTLEDGIYRKITCLFREDRWRPKLKFESCKPFVDCTLTGSAQSYIRCNTRNLNTPDECEITCESYKGQKAIPAITYACDINGTWNPKLPYCVKAGSGIDLVPVPKHLKSFQIGNA